MFFWKHSTLLVVGNILVTAPTWRTNHSIRTKIRWNFKSFNRGWSRFGHTFFVIVRLKFFCFWFDSLLENKAQAKIRRVQLRSNRPITTQPRSSQSPRRSNLPNYQIDSMKQNSSNNNTSITSTFQMSKPNFSNIPIDSEMDVCYFFYFDCSFS